MGCVRGGGSLRRRRLGVWEVRVALGPDPVSGRTRVRSVTVHGDRETAQAARERWAASAELLRSAGRARPGITLACLLREWLAADHGWRPSTVAGYRSAVGFLARDRIGSRRAIDVSPAVLAAAITAWRADGWTDPTVWARVRALRSALGWAHVERILAGDRRQSGRAGRGDHGLAGGWLDGPHGVGAGPGAALGVGMGSCRADPGPAPAGGHAGTTAARGAVARPGRAGPRHPGPRPTAGHGGSARERRRPAGCVTAASR